MDRKIAAKSLWIIIVLSIFCAIPCADAFAWDGGQGRSRGHEEPKTSPRHRAIDFGGSRYHYDHGRFYRSTWFFGLVIARPPIGIIVDVVPDDSRVIVRGGIRYYCYENVYYEECPTGYVVVPTPPENYVTASLSQPATSAAGTAETVQINVPNSNGSYTTVKLTKSNNGYIGPQGEFYAGHPTVEQLKALYGS